MSQFNSEIQNIKSIYQKRSLNPLKESLYFTHYFKSERELKYTEILDLLFNGNLRECKILEIGAGGGDNLIFFHRIGIPWQNIFANELLDDRILMLQKNLIKSNIYPGNALDLDFERFFDIVFQSTVFSSVLDYEFKRSLALKMMKMVKADGLILWYDFVYNNPNNNNVRGIRKGEVRELFREAKEIYFHNVTLAPPIGRKIGKCYNLVNSLFPFLRTHLIAVIRLK